MHRQSRPQKRPGISMRLSCPQWIRNTGFIQSETGPKCCNSVAALSVRTSPLNPWWIGWWVILQSRCLNFQSGRACFVLKRTLSWEAVAPMTHGLCLCSKETCLALQRFLLTLLLVGLCLTTFGHWASRLRQFNMTPQFEDFVVKNPPCYVPYVQIPAVQRG